MDSKYFKEFDEKLRKFFKVKDNVDFLNYNKKSKKKFKSIKKFVEFKNDLLYSDKHSKFFENVSEQTKEESEKEFEKRFVNKYDINREKVNFLLYTINRNDIYFNSFGFSYNGMTIFDLLIDSTDDKDIADKIFNDKKREFDEIGNDELLQKLIEFMNNKIKALEIQLNELKEN